MRDFKKIMTEHRYWKDSRWNETDKVYTFETGSQIEFFSSDNGDKLRGARRDRLFINEANNVAFDAFQQLEVRTKDLIFLDWNPTNEFWYYTDVKPYRNDIEELTVTFMDNEALDPQIRDSILQRKMNKSWWKVYGLGQLGEIESKIYRNWAMIDEIPHGARLERTGIDFGYYADPTVVVDVYYYDGGYIWDEVLYQRGTVENKKIADILLAKPDKALAKADRSESRSIDEIKTYGGGIMIMPSLGGKGSVLAGISFVQAQKISVTKRSVNIIKEYRNYIWTTDKDGKIINEPEHAYSHSMDAGRYAMEDLYAVSRNDEQEQAERLLARLRQEQTSKR